ncbi:MAG TPA: PP2C family protein-serine/threonine phosphatase [Candidatus Angelobacter sp.]|nr:PP2C family protein-serine/threonine phosphatase [Candidatus Angelobacter sp.]
MLLPLWTTSLGFATGVLFLSVAVRWFRTHVMWRLRNQLIVTYLFIGAVPVLLVASMAVLAGQRFLGQFATFLTVSEFQFRLQQLAASNSAAAERIIEHGDRSENLAALDPIFTGRTIQIFPAASRPRWLQDRFSGLVLDHGRFYLRAAEFVDTKNGRLVIISSVPAGEKLLAGIATDFGSLTLSYSDLGLRRDRNPESKAPAASPFEGERYTAGTVPPARNLLDREFEFSALVPAIDWNSGRKEGTAMLAGTTRPGLIYTKLSAHLGEWTDTISVYVIVFSVLFSVMVLTALYIGLRLMRTITGSVANLYEATQRINLGDFTHRIKVKERDQLAALQVAFNSMTESLQRLIAEHKEKERMQSELEIAHEVQEQLFPRAMAGTRALELYGVCRPARTVSGDYYDFLLNGPDHLGIAVGDISGKGISAALLMASIHSAVRAYEQETLVMQEAASAYGSKSGGSVLAAPAVTASPARMLQMLNRHLYRSTAMEKYATLFLGFYDGESHRITYSNAGHLPPVILSPNGSIRRLDAGGMVVGLFDNRTYEEQTVDFRPGDIFIAFSDGITEPENEFGEFGEQRLIETVFSNRHLPLERITDHVIAAVQDWIGSAEAPDDITLVLARRSM